MILRLVQVILQYPLIFSLFSSFKFHIFSPQCIGLEELLQEEETDINDVLEIIKTMQKTGALPPGSGPISPMSAIGAKLRELNHK